MTTEQTLTVLTALVGVGVSILLAGIPWAYMVHGELASIKAQMSSLLSLQEKHDNLVAEVHQHGIALARLQGKNGAT